MKKPVYRVYFFDHNDSKYWFYMGKYGRDIALVSDRQDARTFSTWEKANAALDDMVRAGYDETDLSIETVRR